MKKADVVVIGGGVVGAAITYYLAKKDVNVALVEKDDLASGTSGHNSGGIASVSKQAGIHRKIGLESAKLYDELVKELDYDIEYKKTGMITVFETDEEMETWAKFVRGIRTSLKWLNVDQARRLCPVLSEHILGATYNLLHARVNPMNLTFGLAQAAQRRGGRIYTYTKVQSIRTKNDQVASVITDRGEIRTSTAVNAAGLDAPAIGKMVNVNIQITPVKGQMVVMERTSPLLKHVIGSARYVMAKLFDFKDPKFKIPVAATGINQQISGNIMFGTTLEQAVDLKTTIEGIKAIVYLATRIVPALKNLHIIRTYAGLRPKSPDGLPILGTVENVGGFVLACGLGHDGVCLAPVTGKLISELIVDGKPSMSLEELELSRFIK